MSNEQKPNVDALKRYELYCEATTKGFFVGPEATEDGRFVMHDDALAWVASVRREARAEAFEEAAAIVRDADLTMDRRRILLKIIAAKESAS